MTDQPTGKSATRAAAEPATTLPPVQGDVAAAAAVPPAQMPDETAEAKEEAARGARLKRAEAVGRGVPPADALNKAETAAVEKQDAIDAERGYTTERWHGFVKRQCVQCPFDTMDVAAMDTHLAAHRGEGLPASQQPSGRTVPMYDRFGVIARLVEVP